MLLTLRRSESLLVTLAIPLGILVFFSKVDAVTDLSDPVDFLVPGVLALAVMSTAMVSLGIATGYERRYGVLKRIGSTPLSRGGLLTAKTANVLLIELAQAAIIVVVGIALGWSTSARILPAVVLLLVGTVAFAGIGLLMAGTLRAETNLARCERRCSCCSCSSAGWRTRSAGSPPRSRTSPRRSPRPRSPRRSATCSRPRTPSHSGTCSCCSSGRSRRRSPPRSFFRWEE